MNFEQLENDIVSRLQPLATESIEVIALPETEKDFKRGIDDARITVAFNGAEWQKNTTTDKISQTLVVTTGVVVQARFLRGEKGVYQLFDNVRKLLIGYAPTGCYGLYVKSFDLFSDEEETFTFVAFLDCETFSVEDYTEPTTPVVTKIYVEGNFYVPPIEVVAPAQP